MTYGREEIMKILLTAFEPFLDHTTNPTIELVRRLKSETISTMTLPVVYEKAAQQVIEHAQYENYDFILLLGLAADRQTVSIEHHALNLMDATTPDNEGVIKRFEVIDENRPDLYLTDIPYQTILLNADSKQIQLSLSAGGYICNDTFYRVKNALNNHKVGFIHVPKETTIDLDTQEKIIRWIISIL
jgi:pyroglutamyl-peptidase